MAVYWVRDWPSRKPAPHALVEALKGHSVVGVFDDRRLKGSPWGGLFQHLASAFYVTGFRPLLINFLGDLRAWDAELVSRTLERALETGVVTQPFFREPKSLGHAASVSSGTFTLSNHIDAGTADARGYREPSRRRTRSGGVANV